MGVSFATFSVISAIDSVNQNWDCKTVPNNANLYTLVACCDRA